MLEYGRLGNNSSVYAILRSCYSIRTLELKEFGLLLLVLCYEYCIFSAHNFFKFFAHCIYSRLLTAKKE